MKWLQHLRTINRHRRQVRKLCFKIGLYRQGLCHDLSKYSPSEFLVGAKYFQGTRSPNDAEREATGVSTAWLHHKGRNKHHLEYWIDYGLSKSRQMEGMKMPVKYVAEMFCDRVAASKVYKGSSYKDSDPYEYFLHSVPHYIIHPETRDLLGSLLLMLSEKGEDATLRYIRHDVLGKR